MARFPQTFTSTVALRRFWVGLGLALCVSQTAIADEAGPGWMGLGFSRGGSSARSALFQPNDDWRARGLAFVDLPFRFRARFDANYRRFQTHSDDLAAPLVSAVGPGRLQERQIESRIALTRPLVEGVELEVMWETRNGVERRDPMAFGRQVVGAVLRITR